MINLYGQKSFLKKRKKNKAKRKNKRRKILKRTKRKQSQLILQYLLMRKRSKLFPAKRRRNLKKVNLSLHHHLKIKDKKTNLKLNPIRKTIIKRIKRR